MSNVKLYVLVFGIVIKLNHHWNLKDQNWNMFNGEVL